MSWANKSKWLLWSACASACVHTPGGEATFSVVSQRVYRADEAEVVAHVDERRCLHSVLIAAWGESPDHECHSKGRDDKDDMASVNWDFLWSVHAALTVSI
jgi:hypothetical protein